MGFWFRIGRIFQGFERSSPGTWGPGVEQPLAGGDVGGGGTSALRENVLLGPPGLGGCGWTGKGTPPAPLSSVLTP